MLQGKKTTKGETTIYETIGDVSPLYNIKQNLGNF